MGSQNICYIKLANQTVRLNLLFSDTKEYFRSFFCEPSNSAMAVGITEEIFKQEVEKYECNHPDKYYEYYRLIIDINRVLFPTKRCIYHGTAFIWRGKAWILTAVSGTGKTTQYRLWNQLFGDEIEVINGDKPVLEFRDDKSVWVWPSPWNGKENYRGTKSAELAGIVILEQADENTIERVNARDSIISIFRQFLFLAETVDEIRAAEPMLDTLLCCIPVWKLRNLGDLASAKLTYDTLQRYLEVCKDE